MILSTVVRDCLYLNWALPVGGLPEPPTGLRYEVRSGGGEDWVFASALLFRQAGLRFPALPFLGLSYSQFNLRVHVLDREDVSSVLFWRVLVPAWVVPGAWLIGRQPAGAAHFSYPPPLAGPDGGPWRWSVWTADRLEIRAEPGPPAIGPGPAFPSWPALVEQIRQRPRGYAVVPSGLRRVQTWHPPVAVWPLRAEIEERSLLSRCAPGIEVAEWPPLHSAWLCPEIHFVFELNAVPGVSVQHPAPAPI